MRRRLALAVDALRGTLKRPQQPVLAPFTDPTAPGRAYPVNRGEWCSRPAQRVRVTTRVAVAVRFAAVMRN
jgi:hypothetical protein